MSFITPDSQPLNMTHTFSFRDLQGPLPLHYYRRHSIMSVLLQEFSLFASLVEKAGFAEKLDDPAADFTLFAPSDEHLRALGFNEQTVASLDSIFAVNLVKLSLLNRRITRQLIQDTPFFQMQSYDRRQFLYFSTISDTTRVNAHATITAFDTQCANGIIHTLDALLQPTFFY